MQRKDNELFSYIELLFYHFIEQKAILNSKVLAKRNCFLLCQKSLVNFVKITLLFVLSVCLSIVGIVLPMVRDRRVKKLLVILHDKTVWCNFYIIFYFYVVFIFSLFSSWVEYTKKILVLKKKGFLSLLDLYLIVFLIFMTHMV